MPTSKARTARPRAARHEFRDTVAWMHRSFAELRYEEMALLADAGRVIAWAVLHGTHVRPFLGLAADGRPFAVEQVHLFRCADGRLTGHRAVRDDLRLLMRLGARSFCPTAARSRCITARPTDPPQRSAPEFAV